MFRRCSGLLVVKPIESSVLAKTLAAPPMSGSWNLTTSSSNASKQIITKEFTFKDFHAAFAFMTKSTGKINEMDHHPEWFNVYNRVRIELTTHDAGNKISEKDIELAKHFDVIAKQFE